MKILVTLFLTLIWLTTSAQTIDINKAWVGENLAYIKFTNLKVHIEVFGTHPKELSYYIKGDTLRMFEQYLTSIDKFAKEHITNYDFLISRLTSKNLVLIALDSNSLQISGGKKKLIYLERTLVNQPTIDFELIKFETDGGCYNGCQTLKLQIDKEKNLKFIGSSRAIKQGFYTAEISDSLYNLLISILRISELDKLKTWKQIVLDAPEYTLEIQYNGKIKYLKSFDLPAVTSELIKYLFEISQKVKLIESKQPFKIDFTEQEE